MLPLRLRPLPRRCRKTPGRPSLRRWLWALKMGRGGAAAPPAVEAQASGEAADVQAPTVGSGSAARAESLERPGENVTCEGIGGDEDGALDDDEEGALDKAEASNSVMQMYRW